MVRSVHASHAFLVLVLLYIGSLLSLEDSFSVLVNLEGSDEAVG